MADAGRTLQSTAADALKIRDRHEREMPIITGWMSRVARREHEQNVENWDACFVELRNSFLGWAATLEDAKVASYMCVVDITSDCRVEIVVEPAAAIGLHSDERSFLVVAQNDIERDQWAEALQQAIDAAAYREHRTIPGQMSRIQAAETIGEASRAAFKREVQGGQPRRVYVRLQVFDIKAVRATDSTVEIDFAIYMRWYDPALIHASKQQFRRTVHEYEQLWSPGLEVNNGVELREMWDGNTSWNLKDYETGEMKYSQRYFGIVANQMDLRAFPFDADAIPITIGPKVKGAELPDPFLRAPNLFHIRLEHDPEHSIRTTKVACKSLIDWEIDQEVGFQSSEGSAGHSNATFIITARRRYAYYMWKFMSINIGVCIYSWAIFLIPPGSLQERLEMIVTIFLAEVAFGLVLSADLPRVPYLTVLDQIVVGTYALLFL
eukprot:134845-Pleurochrysis_carterae.AAC.1